MTTLNLSNKVCVSSLKLLGDFWTLRIIDALSDGEVRYCELQRKAGEVNPVTLTNKLKNLQQSGLIERHEVTRADVTYQLTALGKKVLPILSAVNDFSVSASKLK